MSDASHPILLYDGIWGLCNRFVQFLLRRDHAEVFRFAALQSPLAAQILHRHGASATHLDTVYVVVDPQQTGERLLGRSDAAIFGPCNPRRHLGCRSSICAGWFLAPGTIPSTT